jgi:carbamoyl-phosphate synthase large subunit
VAGDDSRVIEINARFGGGFPLSRQAGADFPRWMVEEHLQLPSSVDADGWVEDLVMLRYDAAVFVPAGPDVLGDGS